MSSPKVTVYITNHNYAAFIEQAVDSVRRQTFTNYELLIIDDGSTDNSREIILKYEKQPNTFVIFQENKGLNRTNNVALRLARGEYVVRLDADDYLHETALEKMVRVLDADKDVALVFPDYYNVDEQGRILNQYQRFDFSQKDLLLDRPAHGAITMIRKEVLQQVGGYNEKFVCQDGYDLWLKVFNKYKISNINEPLFYYRQHGSNLTTNKERLLHTRAEMMDEYARTSQLPELNVVAVVPVRGGAIDPRSLPLREIGGKKLIEWTIDHALNAKYISHVAVSTPDPQVEQFLKERYEDRVLVLKRPLDLARINTSISDTLFDALSQLETRKLKPDAIMTLYVEAPFRGSRYIDQAVNHMRIYKVECVDGVIEDTSFFYRHMGKGLEPVREMSFLQLERDDIFRRAGGLHLIKSEIIRAKKDAWKSLTSHIVLDQKAAFHIKSELDFKMAEFLALQGGQV